MAHPIKTYSDYAHIRHNNPNDYYKTATQRQMFLDQVSSGASVFYEYPEQSNDYQINS